ncbi:MAG TPA: hypothetical protein VIE88_08350 [Vicinamibacteria bacterium]|jgi:hypothetical protein
MGLLSVLGLGKDPHVEWMVEAFRAETGEVVVNRLYQSAPEFHLWRGEAQGVPVTFYTEGGNKYRGGHAVCLGKAGPQFMEGVSEYRCFFYRPQLAPSLSIDESRWAAAVEKAMGDPEWSLSFPEEAFELGVAVGRFAMELDCPLDPRPVFAHLEALRAPLDKMSDAVERVYLYPSGVAVGFNVQHLTKEKLLADVSGGLEILRLSPR